MILESCGINMASLLPDELKKKCKQPYVEELLDAILSPATLAIVRILSLFKHDSLKGKGNHLDIFTRSAAFNGPIAAKSLSCS